MANLVSEVAQDESRALLARADAVRMTRREVAELLGISVSRVSDYYKLLKDGTGDAIPLNSRRVLQGELERREAATGRPPQYPSERGAYTHNLLERLGAETNFSGARWEMVVGLIESALRLPKEERDGLPSGDGQPSARGEASTGA